ncbi:hypothetical protein CBER1_07343 [Cercospora berteroae]|uniref:Uncharacterized protein n=1 Tax=Cercospora berteroae TaxID=357750 RepID=A0A2S6CL40_9PEZI|nr:hypothetical protein CBER1_07343 [Cercospora berteroae]
MPSEADLSYLDAALHLDREDATYYGPDDNITGCATVTFKPIYGMAQLSGPLVIKLVLKGALKDNRRRDRGLANSSMFSGYRGDRALCDQTVCLHDAPVRLSKGDTISLPFSISFPEFADSIASPISPRVSGSIPRHRLPTQHEQLDMPPGYDEVVPDPWRLQEPRAVPQSHERLPPAVSLNRYPKPDEIEVGYLLSVIAKSASNVEGVIPRNASQRINYLPSTWQTVQGTDAFFHDFTVRSRSLLDHKARDDTRGAIKFMYGNWLYKEEYTPTFVGRLHVSGIPSIIALHDQGALSEISFQISIYPQWDRCTIAELPDISLKTCKVHMVTIMSSGSSSTNQQRVRDEQPERRTIREVGIKSVEPEGPFHAMPVEKDSSNHPVQSSTPNEERRSSKGKAPAYLDRFLRREEEPAAGPSSLTNGAAQSRQSPDSSQEQLDHDHMDSDERAQAEKGMLAKRMAELDMKAGPSHLSAPQYTRTPTVSKSLPTDQPHAYVTPKMITTVPIYDVPATISTYTSRRHEIRIQVDLLIGKQVIGATRSIPLLVHESERAEGEPVGSPSAADEHEGMGIEDELPSYEDAVGLGRR